MFQYPLVDRVGFEGHHDHHDRRNPGAFQYPLVDRVGFEGRNRHREHEHSTKFQYPLVDRVGFEGAVRAVDERQRHEFQYPLVDRVGFEGRSGVNEEQAAGCFSILWWIELVLRVAWPGGITYLHTPFQYPLVDRVGFEGTDLRLAQAGNREFQYPLVDRVGFEGQVGMLANNQPPCFSILWWIELVLRDRPDQRHAEPLVVSVSSGGSSWF